MLKVLDMLAMSKGAPQPSYEAIAMNEYKQNPNAYIFANKVIGST
jgi:hypothetical protein